MQPLTTDKNVPALSQESSSGVVGPGLWTVGMALCRRIRLLEPVITAFRLSAMVRLAPP